MEQTRRVFGEDSPVVCVMSGNWTQRGQAAVADKWTRAKAALWGGADLILELPSPWATASAETFARGGVELLAMTGVVEVLGTLLGYFAVSVVAGILPIALAFAGGAMLYVVSDEMIPETHSHGYERAATWSLLAGFALMLLVKILLHLHRKFL